MRAGKTPLFRKAIVPWYDSDAVCYSVMALMTVVLFFSVFGVVAAGEVPEYRGNAWVPLLLLMMSLGVLISTVTRLVRRNARPASGIGF